MWWSELKNDANCQRFNKCSLPEYSTMSKTSLTAVWAAALLYCTEVWTGEKSRRKEHRPKRDPAERHTSLHELSHPEVFFLIKPVHGGQSRKEKRISSFSTCNEVMIHGQTTRAHFPFESLLVSWDVTAHPPPSYLSESHLMVNIHTRRHRRHACKTHSGVDLSDGFVILDFYVCVFIFIYLFFF